MANPKRSSGKMKKREKKNIPEGIVYIQSTFNNTIVTIADKQGDVISWSSSGWFAAQKAVAEAAKKAMDNGMRKVEVRVKGPGPGREAALRALQVEGFDVSKISDVTPLPHNGCKPPKRRRV
jgi:small subunit ribosomal protein S11